ncbi:MAG: histidine--tRNA ligase [Spirochaetaceae bacterium]|jgi:histidyl-tRNA synthetase|nr:histidine--tRNA ligase [Spirochaetaceae bacterium]
MLIQPRILKGFRDSLPEQEIEKSALIKNLVKTFESFGFVPIDTPALELTEVLLGKGGGETDKQMYRFQDKGKRDVSMRFDLTVPFARYMAQHYSEIYLPFKRYHIAKVWRGENTQRGRYREFFQCDFDMVGVDSASSDFEILMMMKASLSALGVDKATIHINHRGIFNRFLNHLGLAEKSVEVLRMVDKLTKIGREKVLQGLSEYTEKDKAELILDFIVAEDSFEKTLKKMCRLAGGPGEDSQRMEDIWAMAKELELQEGIILNPSITRGLDYYTGLVYETFLDELPGLGSVCSGGRYNNLASLYSKEELPGVGASVGLDRLLAGLDEINKNNLRKSLTDVIIFNMDPPLSGQYHKMAQQLRKQGIRCEVYPAKKKLQGQFKFAEQKDIPLGIICGVQEMETGTLNLKDLKNRESWESISLAEAIEKIIAFLDREII